MSVLRAGASDNAAPDRPPILVDENEAARLCGVSRPTFRLWAAAGLINKVTLPDGCRRNLYRTADLEQFAANLAASASR